LGRQQAGLLGDYFATQQFKPDIVYAGALQRQQQTAQIVCERLRGRSVCAPDIVTDERWNEFSLAAVYQGMAARLCEERAEFARDCAEMQQALLIDPQTTRGAAGRCDRAIIEAWMHNRYPDYEGESWATFRARVQSSLPDFINRDVNESIAVFTSATPIAIWAGAALGLTEAKILGLMGMLYNASITTLKLREGEPWLFNFNTTPHLNEAALRTFR
jgi:broad specificity phosphatase PhoE